MANSTLNPGRPSAAIVKLREAALKEMEAPELNVAPAPELTFDKEHDERARSGDSESLAEVPQFHGTNNPHVGNGAGPIG